MPSSDQSSTDVEPRGSVAVELELTGRWAISLLTEGWTAEEKAALLAGDEGAREALLDAAEEKTLRQPDDLELVHSKIYLNDPNADQSSEQSANKPTSAATNQTPARESDA